MSWLDNTSASNKTNCFLASVSFLASMVLFFVFRFFPTYPNSTISLYLFFATFLKLVKL